MRLYRTRSAARHRASRRASGNKVPDLSFWTFAEFPHFDTRRSALQYPAHVQSHRDAPMPRPPRLHVPGGYYHVILRGNHREDLFATPNDHCALNDIVIEVLQRLHARLHAYCWMTNHLHALVQIGERPLGQVMQRIAMRYSRYRHRALKTTGHLFERRYKALLVDVDQYFLTLLRNIHLDPVEAHIVKDPADYAWSSHPRLSRRRSCRLAHHGIRPVVILRRSRASETCLPGLHRARRRAEH